MGDSLQWAYLEDLPAGTRLTPDDGPWPRAYYLLEDEEIWEEFERVADPSTVLFSRDKGWRADGVNFQPAPTTNTQDRYVLKQLNIHGRRWTLTGVFDGHLGDETVEHVAHHLPIIVEEFLSEHLKQPQISPAFISNLFSRSIVAFDDAIAGDILDLFGGSDRLDEYSDHEISEIINDQHKGGDNYRKARLCMYGTTALVALTDPDHENLWVANLGDCQAVLVSPKATEGWDVEFITAEHNGANDAEIARVHREHPGEPECVVDRRVLGALAPTRGLGDVPFKQPPAFTRRILYNLAPGFSDTAAWERCLERNITPPYISAAPEVTHRRLPRRNSRSSPRPRYLILATDGFAELCRGHDAGEESVLVEWAMREDKDQIKSLPDLETQDNLACRLLRQALGGEDRAAVSAMLTLDVEDSAWVDDTAVVVQTL
ncbi:Mitochondrial type 2c protein [Mycena indigotica]|uniref:Mitochondrial type 2c protein n=1 Tax=Mycena indigotica TaxID=2126181 RepID=A0A8H6SA40_9AGAR|nr:Mitochondrial type 2c protein [Mycena indigotica]KAF7294567.1 Mitochondrial type 2c protein [Mycena indigotica]